MAAITTAGSGNWSSTTPNAPWPSGAIPGTGDTVTIANGHTVTLTDARTIGTSPTDDAGTPAIQTSGADGTGIFVMADGATLTMRGPIRQSNLNWVIGKDCTIIHDSSLASVPANAHYSWQIGAFANSIGARLTVNGTPGHRTWFKIAAGSGAAGGFQGTGTPGNNCNQMVATSMKVTDWGLSSQNLLRPSLVTSGAKCTFDSDCVFDRCGGILAYNCVNGCDFIFDGKFRSPAGTSGVGADFGGNGFSPNPSTGTRRITGYIEGRCSCWTSPAGSASGIDFGESGTGKQLVLAGTTGAAPFSTGGLVPQAKSWRDVFIANRQATDLASELPAGTLNRTTILRWGNNGHFVDAIIRAVTVDGWIAESAGILLGSGDIFQTATNAVAHFAVKILNGLALPCSDGKSIGVVANHSDVTAINGTTRFGPQITMEHNTFFTEDGGTGLCEGAGGENSTGFAGLHASTRANLVLRSTPGIGFICKWFDAQVASLAAGTYANADYNGYDNITPSTTKDRYYRQDTNPSQYTGTPGTHDVATGDPQFVDSTRKFLTWAQSVDPTVATWDDALARFSLMSDEAGYVAGFSVAAMYDWIRAGRVPTNAAVNTSYPGDAQQYLGFAQAVASGPTAGQKNYYRRLQGIAAAIAGLVLTSLSLFGVRHV